MVKSHDRGHEIYYDGENWRYRDDNSVANHERPCIRCGKTPTQDGCDACLGHIEGATHACCGHGVEDKYVIY